MDYFVTLLTVVPKFKTQCREKGNVVFVNPVIIGVLPYSSSGCGATFTDGVRLQLWVRAHLYPIQDTGRWCETPAVVRAHCPQYKTQEDGVRLQL
jgi:hypothetical protein